jgi:hypothetical protein
MDVGSAIYSAPPSPNAESRFEECSISILFQLKTMISRHLYCDRRKMSRRLSFDEESPITLFFERIRRLSTIEMPVDSLLTLVDSQHKNN